MGDQRQEIPVHYLSAGQHLPLSFAWMLLHHCWHCKAAYGDCRSGRKRSRSPDEEGEVSEAEEQTMPVDFHGIVNQAVCVLFLHKGPQSSFACGSPSMYLAVSDAKSSVQQLVSSCEASPGVRHSCCHPSVFNCWL